MLHVGIVAARKALDYMERQGCHGLVFGSAQCSECLALVEPSEETDSNALEYCECCGTQVRILRPRELKSTSFSDEAHLANR